MVGLVWLLSKAQVVFRFAEWLVSKINNAIPLQD